MHMKRWKIGHMAEQNIVTVKNKEVLINILLQYILLFLLEERIRQRIRQNSCTPFLPRNLLKHLFTDWMINKRNTRYIQQQKLFVVLVVY